MKGFWDRSWDHVDMERINAYIDAKETEPMADFIMDHLKERQVRIVCDAGCGCGAYALKLALHGFRVSGFDISSAAVSMTKELLSSRGIEHGDFRACDIAATGYGDDQFDAVICRDVLDHMTLADGIAAFRELYRIVKGGGLMILTLDQTDDEYETEPHTVNSDGDYLFTAGKWEGMVFHPYSESEITKLIQMGTITHLGSAEGEFQIVVVKQCVTKEERGG